jgi:hypothetical protein
MIVCISPSLRDAEETYNVLKFSALTQEVTTKPSSVGEKPRKFSFESKINCDLTNFRIQRWARQAATSGSVILLALPIGSHYAGH